MGNARIFFMVAAMLAACGLAFPEPILQVSNYSTMPSEVYAGTVGYVQVTLYNSGDSSALAVSPHYVFDGVSQSDLIGDIASKSSSQVSVPFKISEGAAGTIQLLNIDIYYSHDSGSSTSSKKTALSIPLTVKQYSPLVVRTASMDKTQISAGERLSFALDVANTGGVVNNLVITMPDNSSFYIDGTTQKGVGTIPSNSTVQVTLDLVSATSTATGTYSVPVIFTYQDMAKQPTNKTLGIGPISVLDTSVQYRLSLVPEETVEIGSEVPFNLSLQNRGSYPISGVVLINSTSVFTPIGMQRVYFDSVPAGQTASKGISLGVSSSASAGYYMLPLTLTPSTGQSLNYNVGVIVYATPQITVTLDTTGSTPTIEVANTGNSQVRSVYASVTPQGASTATKSFIGTLDVDDFASVSLDSAVSSVTVELSFRDSSNREQTVTKTLQSSGGNSSFQQGFGGRSSNSSDNGSPSGMQGRSSNPLGMLLGPGGSASSGPDMVTLGIAAIVLVAGVGGAGYCAYRRFWKGKAHAPQQPAQHSEVLEKGRKAK